MIESTKLYIIDDSGNETMLEYQPFEYRNLMELVEEELWEEWGDCRGRAMCGTCHIEIWNPGTAAEASGKEMEPFEEHTLDGLPNKTSRSRLACQITTESRSII